MTIKLAEFPRIRDLADEINTLNKIEDLGADGVFGLYSIGTGTIFLKGLTRQDIDGVVDRFRARLTAELKTAGVEVEE